MTFDIKYLRILFLILIHLCISLIQAQTDKQLLPESHSAKGRISISWGWNRSAYSASNIKFKGPDYRFRLYDVYAHDRQSKLGFTPYLNPGTITIPQFNLRVEYMISDRVFISIGQDHMKYVISQNQQSLISGTIWNSGTRWDNIYNRTPIEINTDLLTFEHTDGLNYINFHAGYSIPVSISDKFKIAWNNAASTGILVPKTNSKLLNNERHDDFNLAGYGFDLQSGIKLSWNNLLFTQFDVKSGYIDMPNIRTTHKPEDKASQHFWFTEISLIFGFQFNTATAPVKSKNRNIINN